MNKWIIFIVLFLFYPNLVFGEITNSDLEEKNGIYFNKQLNVPFSGTTIERYKNGKKLFVRNYKNGERHGTVEMYLPNGVLKSSVSYKNGKEHGPSYFYDDNGQPSIITNYNNGRKHGLMETHMDGLNQKIHYKNGVQDGLSLLYFDGTLFQKKCYKDDQEVELSECQN
jgi:antitoxin component YwqK of YwqJK toxin-antitoxin module